jgi:hypothetical protein
VYAWRLEPLKKYIFTRGDVVKDYRGSSLFLGGIQVFAWGCVCMEA